MAPSFASTVTVDVERLVLPGRKEPVALVRLDSTGSGGLIIWGSEALHRLRDVLSSVDQSSVEAIVVSGNARSFGAGADLREVRHAQLSGVWDPYVALGHEAFGILAESSVPTFCLVTGQALGGGLELALHTDYRLAHPRTGPLGLPECRLGFFPGWGGVHLLPHLIGPAAALRMIVFDAMRGRNLSAQEALGLGLVDAVLDATPGSGTWDPEWQRWVAGKLAAFDAGEPRRRAGTPGGTGEPQWRDAVEQARARAGRTWHGAAPAPLVAIGLVADARTETRAENGAKAVAAFAELVRGDVAKDSLYAYELVAARSRRAADVPAAEPMPVRRAAVIGAGLMAGQLAFLLAGRARIPVLMTDLDDERLAAGVARTRERFAAQADSGRITAREAEQLGALVTGARGPEDLADADLVIEAVPEDLAVKKAVLAQCERIVRPDAILATNTSSLSVTSMAVELQHPERVVGFHVFNPVEVTPLVEIVAGERTGPVALATAFQLAATLRRTAVRVQDAPGFVVNRVLTRMFDVVVRALDDGTDPATADHAADPLGLPMTPLQLLDFVGPAVLHHVHGTMRRAYPERFAGSPWLSAVAGAGLDHVLPARGESGRGTDGYLGADAARLLERTRAERPGLAAPSSAEELLERIQDALAEEIGAMLREGVVAGPEDVDLCVILGANHPFHLGGITPYLDRTGTSERVLGHRFHEG